MTRSLLAVLGVALVLAGCSASAGHSAGKGSPSPAPTESETPPVTAPSTPSATAGKASTRTPDRVNAKILVEFRRTGGFAGLEDYVTVYGDGRARVSRTGSQKDVRLSATELSTLRTNLKRLDMDRPGPPPQVADGFEYTIIYGGRSVTRYHDMPPSWRPVVTQLESLLTR